MGFEYKTQVLLMETPVLLETVEREMDRPYLGYKRNRSLKINFVRWFGIDNSNEES
jgi:hypothetical protein